jgi:rod shape determining protein RodA
MTAVAPARARVTTTRPLPLWRRLDWLLIGSVAGLCAIGCLLVWSATVNQSDLTGGADTAYLAKQATNVVVGGALAALVAATDHRALRIWAPAIYVTSIAGLLLIFVPGIGTTINGSRSWLTIGGLTMQPAEFAKLGILIGMALVLAERAEGRLRTRSTGSDLVPALLIAALPALLILAQPDLGTLIVLTAIVFGVIALAGAGKRWLVGLIGVGAAAVAAAMAVGVLADYQLDRFRAFTDPSLDPDGAGYNTIQSRVAIGNGGVFGEGLFDGSQTQAGFVPEQHTDFVFTVAGEELGLVGAADRPRRR